VVIIGISTIASRDQFKPIRIGEDLMVNYKNHYCMSCIALSKDYVDNSHLTLFI